MDKNSKYGTFINAMDKKTKISGLPINQLRTDLNKQLLAGKYQSPLGEIAFTPEGEIIQKEFYVAQIAMSSDGNSGKFAFIK